MKRLIYSWFGGLIIAVAMLLCACDPTPISVSEDVDIELTVEQVSAGFCRVKFSTSDPAYYLIGCEKARDTEAPYRIPHQFMMLALDSAYMEYVSWRHKLLLAGSPYIAEFPDHSLQYGDADKCFQYLEPDADYWIFAFVVDATSNKPVGDLHFLTVHTDSASAIPMKFNYRINGNWDYGYPLDSSGAIIADVPWVGATMDSLTLRERGFAAPGHFFADSFATLYLNRKAITHFGVYACENDGVTSTLNFEENHTYYTAMASLDGPISKGEAPKYFSMFRFTWKGDSTQLFMTHDKDNTAGAW